MALTVEDRIIPGNYWLTKSMEFNRVNKSGTLWYLKKWIVIYNLIFLKDTRLSSDYLQVYENFSQFIASLPPIVQDNAKEFFFSVDLKSINFMTFEKFSVNTLTFGSNLEREKFYSDARKYYFMYIMGIGGQSGWKKKIREQIEANKDFVTLRNEISQEMKDGGYSQDAISTQLSDFHAALRNERQIFFYYGFFQGKEDSNFLGFYNLTRLGKSIISSNFYELLAIWEHQKLKMVSQSPVSDINNIPTNTNPEQFGIDPHPYLSLLLSFDKLKSITINSVYKFGISKSKTNLPIVEILDYLLADGSHINSMEKRALGFRRQAELRNDDCRKEILKYCLGIADLPLDKSTNPLTCLTYPRVRANVIKISSNNRFNFLFKNYNIIIKYLDNRYSDMYKVFEESLRSVYTSRARGLPSDVDVEARYQWLNYIINFDENVFYATVYIVIALNNEVFSYNLEGSKFSDSYLLFENVMKHFLINKRGFISLMQNVQAGLESGELFEFSAPEEERYYSAPIMAGLVTIADLERISVEAIDSDIYSTSNRKRNPKLVSALRTYYVQNFQDPTRLLIRCDACSSYTFLTPTNLPYTEFHHLIPFADFGPDFYLNLVSICPSCHRKIHLGKAEDKKALYNQISANNNLKISLEDRIDKMYTEKILEPIHLEFLRKEKIIDEKTYSNYSEISRL